MNRRVRVVIPPQRIEELDPTYLEPGTLVEFRQVFVIQSRHVEDYDDGVRSFPRLGFAYVVRSQFYPGRIDIEERVACRSRPKVGLPKGAAVSVIVNVPVEWVLIRKSRHAQDATDEQDFPPRQD